jgi:hypothetical protein
MTDNASLRIEILRLPLCSESATSIVVLGFRDRPEDCVML